MRLQRSGFTLVEMLVVIGILVLLTTMVAFAINNNRSTDRIRSSARSAQSAFLGARDRAVQAKELRGIRMTRDAGDAGLVVGFEYVRPLPLLTYGNKLDGTGDTKVEFRRLDANNDNFADTAQITIVRGKTGTKSIDWFRLDSNGLFDIKNARVRIPAGPSGTWYNLKPLSLSTPFFVRQTGSFQEFEVVRPVIIDTENQMPSVIGIDEHHSQASLDLQLGNEVTPFVSQIGLPNGAVIDLRWSGLVAQDLARQVDTKSPPPNIDIMFTPRGAVTGAVSASGPIHFLLRDLQDATAMDDKDAYSDSTGRRVPDGKDDSPRRTLSPIDKRNRSDAIVLTLFPQTGNVQTFPIDSTDLIDNSTGAAGADGLADDLFRFAKLGTAAN